MDLGPDILGGGSVCTDIQVTEVGDEDAHQQGVGQLPPQVGLQTDRGGILEKEGRSVDIPPDGGRNDISGDAGGGDIRLPPS